MNGTNARMAAVRFHTNRWNVGLVRLMTVAALGGMLALNAFGQGGGRPGQGGRPGDIGHQGRMDQWRRSQGERNLGDRQIDPRDNPNRPTVTLTLEPASVYAGDQVTLRWRVSLPRDPARRWQEPVQLSSTVVALSRTLQDNAGNSGSHTFTAPQGVTRGTFTLTTGRGLVAATKTVDYRTLERPNITRLRVRPANARQYESTSHAMVGDSVSVEGGSFGDARGDGRVILVVGAQNIEMPVESWDRATIVVTVPQAAPLRSGQILINRRAGRVLSNAMPMEIWGRTVVTSDQLRSFADNVLDIGGTRIRLHHGSNASTVKFGATTKAIIPPARDLSFTVPSVRIGDFRFKVNDMNSRTDAAHDPEVAIVNGQLVLGCLFESGGDEILGEGAARYLTGWSPTCSWTRPGSTCVSRRQRQSTGSSGSDRSAPCSRPACRSGPTGSTAWPTCQGSKTW